MHAEIGRERERAEKVGQQSTVSDYQTTHGNRIPKSQSPHDHLVSSAIHALKNIYLSGSRSGVEYA